MGAGVIREKLPSLIEAVSKSGAVVLWVCDPMHGNTFESPSGYKTRKFDDVIDEVKGFFEVHKKMGTHPGGIHIELTGTVYASYVIENFLLVYFIRFQSISIHEK
jgi:3-deoxy-7-phosphoheptulonate synthase